MKSRQLLAKLCLVTFSVANIPSTSMGMSSGTKENKLPQQLIVPISEINSNSIGVGELIKNYLKKYFMTYLKDQVVDDFKGKCLAFPVAYIYSTIYGIICAFLRLCHPIFLKSFIYSLKALPSPEEENNRIYKKVIGTWEFYCNYSQIKENRDYASNKVQSEVSLTRQVFDFIYYFFTSDLWNGCPSINYVLDGVEYFVGSEDLQETIENIKKVLPVISLHLKVNYPQP